MRAGVFRVSASHNDNGALNLPCLQEYLEEIFSRSTLRMVDLVPALCGGANFQHINHMTMITRYDVVGAQEEMDFICRLNFRMSGIRQSIEHLNGQVFYLFGLLRTPRQFKLYNDGQLAYRVGAIHFFILHCYTCLNDLFLTLCST
jgi:hypothetical protein